MVTQICYLILFLYTALSYRSAQDLKLLMAAMGILIAINAVMGISQFAGHDFMTSDWVDHLVVPDEIGGKISTLQFEKAKMYGTANHYNYLGSIAAMTFPVCTVLALFEKRWKFRIPLILAALLSLMLFAGFHFKGWPDWCGCGYGIGRDLFSPPSASALETGAFCHRRIASHNDWCEFDPAQCHF